MFLCRRSGDTYLGIEQLDSLYLKACIIPIDFCLKARKYGMPSSKILVVEDEGIVSIDIRYILRQIGYPATEVAFSAEEALQKIQRYHPDLVLMDIGLKGKLDGIEAAKILKEKYNIPVIFLTGYADKNTLTRSKSAEPIGYIVKPIDENELKNILAKALQ